MHIPCARLTRAALPVGRLGAALGITLLTISGLAAAQTPREIPVYLGSQLAESEECCDFTTTDPLPRVLAFYESRLHSSPLTAEEYATRNPAMRAQIEQMRRMMPANAEFRVFVLAESGGLFEVMSSAGSTHYSLSPEQLGVGGARWAIEFRRRRNQLGDADRAYLSWLDEHPPANQQDYDLPVYPGSLANRSMSETKSRRCYEAWLVTTDPFDRVVAFYQQKLLGQLRASDQNGASGEPFRFGDPRWEYSPPAEGESGPLPGAVGQLRGERSALNRYVDVYPAGHPEAEGGQIPAIPYFSADRREVVAGAATDAISIRLKTEEPTDVCRGIKPDVKWVSGSVAQNMYTREATYVRPQQ